MSWYRVQEIDILRVGQLYLQADINSTYPSAGTVLYTDGVGGTFFSTAGAGGGGGGGGTVTDAILTSTIQGLGLLSYVSSTQLQSTVQGLGNFYTSTAASGVLGSQLVSTVDGLGTARYASTSFVGAQISSFSTSIAGNLVSRSGLTSTVEGLGTLGYVSSLANTISPTIFNLALASTVAGLGSAGYASTSYVTTQISSFSTSLGAVGGGTLTTANLTSTVAGLGSAGYASTNFVTAQISSFSTSLGAVGGGTLTTANLTSTVAGLGTASYISSAQLVSTVTSIVTNFRSLSVAISTLTTSNLTATTGYVSSLQVDTLQFGSGAGWVQFGPIQASIVSTIQINVDTIYANQVSSSTFVGDGSQLVNLNAATPLQLASTVIGLGTAGYLSTLTGIVSTPFLNTTLASTTQGLGTAGYASTSFVTAQISSFSTSLGAVGAGNLTTANLASTVAGLGTAGYISSSQLFSTVAGIGTGGGGGGISPESLFSTTAGLGTAGYLSTPISASNFQVLYYNADVIQGSEYLTYDGYELTTYNLTVNDVFNLNGQRFYSHGADGFSVNENFDAGNAETTAYHFTSGDANRNIMFSIAKTANFTNMFATYGSSEDNTFVIASETANNTAFEIRQGVGIAGSLNLAGGSLFLRLGKDGQLYVPFLQTASNSNTLYYDSGTGLITYAEAPPPLEPALESTVTGLATLGYISSSQLFSTVAGIGTGGTGGGITTPQLTSTTDGLGTAGYLSSLLDIVSTPFLATSLASTTVGLANNLFFFVQTSFISTTDGLATVGYISSSQLFSTVEGIGTGGGGGGGEVTKVQLLSTTDGLGTIQYASTQRIFFSTISSGVVYWPPINVQTVLIQDWSTAVSTVALFTSNTSNYYSNTVVNTSTPLFSTVAGLGTASYVSTQLVYIPNISTQAVLPFPSINNPPLSTVSAAFGTFSTLTGLNTYTNFITFSNLAQVDSSRPTELRFTTGATVSSFRIESAWQVSFETGANTSLLAQSTPTLLISQTRAVGINCNAPSYTLDVSGTANVSGVLTSRVRVVASTITTSQTIQDSEFGSFFFYTTSTPGLSITLPTASEAGTGWNVTVQNTSDSLQTFTILTTPAQILSRGQTLRIFSDGSSWYFI
jgi:hypothetical protein